MFYYPAIEEKSLLSSMCNGIRRKKINKKILLSYYNAMEQSKEIR